MRVAEVADLELERPDPIEAEAEDAELEPVESELLPPGVFAVLKLDKPIKAHGQQITRIELQEPDLGTLDGIKTGGRDGFNLGYMAVIVSRLGGIPPSAAKQIPLKKLVTLKEQFEVFFGVSL